MVETIGEAYSLGWRLTARCTHGKFDGGHYARECQHRAELDLATLVWTRGAAFPLSSLESRLKCPRCGSRRIVIMFEPPTNHQRAARGGR
jgi:DNA-directed RNA polymerase subunit RPC12/RpoP